VVILLQKTGSPFARNKTIETRPKTEGFKNSSSFNGIIDQKITDLNKYANFSKRINYNSRLGPFKG
jgi:hypothetical protein